MHMIPSAEYYRLLADAHTLRQIQGVFQSMRVGWTLAVLFAVTAAVCWAYWWTERKRSRALQDTVNHLQRRMTLLAAGREAVLGALEQERGEA